jgi:hypothetical protein
VSKLVKFPDNKNLLRVSMGDHAVVIRRAPAEGGAVVFSVTVEAAPGHSVQTFLGRAGRQALLGTMKDMGVGIGTDTGLLRVVRDNTSDTK